jgi:very-short-patch-repair endonuclease
MPEAQRRLWRLLRDRRFAGYKFRREHPMGPYTLDFYCAEASVSVEVDGRQHGAPEQQARDREKENYLLERGIITKRFWNWQVRQQPEVVRQTLWHLLQERRPHPGNVPVDPKARSHNWPPRPFHAKPSLRPNRLPTKITQQRKKKMS